MKKSAARRRAPRDSFSANPLPGWAQDVLTTHRLSASVAAEAVTEAVAASAMQGYKVTATILDADTVEQATLRGDGASTSTLDSAHDKAYTVLTLGAARNEDTSGAIVQRIGPTPRLAAWPSCRTCCWRRAQLK